MNIIVLCQRVGQEVESLGFMRGDQPIFLCWFNDRGQLIEGNKD
jgi:hypothetical protein